MSTATRSKPTGYAQLIRENANFRLLWLGQIVSLFGDWFNLIASAALVATLTKSGFAVGGLFMVRMLAPFLTSPVAGVVADRFNRKNVLIWADLVRGATVFGFLLVRDASWVWLIYILTAAQLGVSGFFFTARTAILPDIVQPRGVGTANAITSTTWSTMLAVGAAAGGLVAGTLGIAAALVVGCGNGLLWVFSTQLLLQLAPGEIRGRVFASEFAFFTLASAAGAGVAGLALDQSVSIAWLLRCMAGLSLFPAAVWGLWTLARASRNSDGDSAS